MNAKAGDIDEPTTIREYDPSWPVLFTLESKRVKSVLGNIITRIEHFGGTAVPGMAGKPIVDLLLVIPQGINLTRRHDVATMQAVMLTKKGGPEVLETVELPLPEPGPGEVRVKVRATGVGATDITMRRGSYPYAPVIPFIPGYESIGIVDAAFDGVGGLRTGQCVSSTRRGGITVWYGFMGARSLPGLARSVLSLFVGARLRGSRGSFYGITMLYRRNPQPFHEDLPKLFDLLAERKISPRIAATLPLLDARKANERLEEGGIDGKLVLVAFENGPRTSRSF